MGHTYPCDICSFDGGCDCCGRCRRQKCWCKEKRMKAMKDFLDWEIEAELKRRRQERKKNKRKLIQDKIDKLQKELKSLKD